MTDAARIAAGNVIYECVNCGNELTMPANWPGDYHCCGEKMRRYENAAASAALVSRHD